jgi:hypothetical protein
MRRTEWGMQFRLQGAAMGEDAAERAGMGGIGASLRLRPNPHFFLDFGVDFLGGIDFNGNKRNESSLVINPTLVINPRHLVQVYLFAGLGVGSARVDRLRRIEEYRYVGADAGAGLEFRVSRRIGIDVDALVFVRDRVDRTPYPEFVEAGTGRWTDSSVGALVRLGLAYYW